MWKWGSLSLLLSPALGPGQDTRPPKGGGSWVRTMLKRHESPARYQNVHIPCRIGCLQSCGFSSASLTLYVEGMVFFTMSRRGRKERANQLHSLVHLDREASTMPRSESGPSPPDTWCNLQPLRTGPWPSYFRRDCISLRCTPPGSFRGPIRQLE